MSKITNDSLTWSDTGCFIAVPIWQQWASKGFKPFRCLFSVTFQTSCLCWIVEDCATLWEVYRSILFF